MFCYIKTTKFHRVNIVTVRLRSFDYICKNILTRKKNFLPGIESSLRAFLNFENLREDSQDKRGH